MKDIYFEYKNSYFLKTNDYYINSHKAKANKDGSFTLHFNCGDDTINNLKVVKNWNGLFMISSVSLYAVEGDYLLDDREI